MKPVLFLRVASVLTLIHSALHTIGGVFGKPAPGVAAATLETMKANAFPAMGMMRTYFDFLRGMGLAVTVFLAVEAIVFWQLGSLAKTDALRLRPILASFTVAYLALAWNAYVYIFLGPVIVEALIAVCLGIAFATAKVPAPVRSGQLAPGRA